MLLHGRHHKTLSRWRNYDYSLPNLVHTLAINRNRRNFPFGSLTVSEKSATSWLERTRYWLFIYIFSSFSRSLWFSSNKRCLCIRFCYFSASRRLLTAALSSSFSQLSNYSKTTVSVLLLARTLFLSCSLFFAYPLFLGSFKLQQQ